MAIEIIVKAPKAYRVTCMHCGTEFRYELNDIIKNLGSPVVSCPGCGERVHHRDQRYRDGGIA